MATVNKKADLDKNTIRISIDSKAKVKIGDLSRDGKARKIEANQALDHDHNWTTTLLPFGIYDLTKENLSIYFVNSPETSDLIVDCLSFWWKNNQNNYQNVEELVINLDNGISNRSDRTQFIKRIIEFSQEYKLKIRLIYYPPYHSKYNPIERCWGVLENYWNGAILDSIDSAINWASNMTSKGEKPSVYFIEDTYEKGIRASRSELNELQIFWQPSQNLPKWDITITP